MNTIKLLILSSLFLISPLIAYSAHIVGGEMTYRCLGMEGGNTSMEITMTMYRDSKSGGAPFDADARFGIFEFVQGVWVLRRTVEDVPVSGIQAITTVSNNPCLIIPPDVGVEKGVYQFVLDLPPTDTEYMITYQRCCRNGTINNIINPGETGSVISVKVSSLAVATCNNSPTFNDFPPIVICNGENVNFDHSATDPEGDIIVYEFCAPLASGGTDGSGGPGTGDPNSCTGVTPSPQFCRPPYNIVEFALPTYSTFNPVGGNPQVMIDSNTGLITGVPNVTGQFVVGICAKEYRDGVLIGEISRDFQFNVTNCDDAVFASMDADEVLPNNTFVINSCGNSEIPLNNRSGLETFIQEYAWRFNIQGEDVLIESRDAFLSLPQTGTYLGTLHINESVGAESCRDSANIIINYYPAIKADFTYDYDTCFAEPVKFTNGSVSGSGNITNYNWSFGDDSLSVDKDPVHLYKQPGNFNATLIVTDVNGCSDRISQNIKYFPVPSLVVIEPNTFIGCKPAKILFKNLSNPIDETYDINWTFGDGGTSKEISPIHTYESEGVYSVEVTLVSPIGCETSASFKDWIKILPGPTAGFQFSPQELNSLNSTIQITDESVDAIDWFYTFGDGGLDYKSEPMHTYRDTGKYQIMQVVRHESGCTDTLIRQVDVLPYLNYQLPNAFTPNNDGLNDIFRGKGQLPGIQDFKMQIWNRWGEMVFESDSPSEGWNGEYHGSGKLLMAGVYVYTISYRAPRGEMIELKGHVTLVR